MAQVKKEAVRRAILRSGKALYRQRGYINTSMSEIASKSGISTSNLYVYYPSKLDIFFAVYEVWFAQQLDALENKVAKLRNPRKRLETILLFFWRDIPRADNNFANNLIQAISTKSSKERYSRNLLLLSESRLSKLIQQCFQESLDYWIKNDLLAHLIFMAHDGFSMNYSLEGPGGRVVKADRVNRIVKGLCELYFKQ